MSKIHDSIVVHIAGKIQRLGFEIKYMEGRHVDVTIHRPELPPKLINHRPDVFGLKETGAVAIGEAKTKSDLKSLRTKTQLLDFKRIVRERSDNLLVIAVPLSAKEDLLLILRDLGIILDSQIDLMVIPEQLLPSNE